ncbi:MAG: NAD(P)H-binding protein [Ilumatobacteraceae bacterium]
MGQKVFVTGGSGVLGRRLVPRLVEAGHQVTAVARSEEKARTLRVVGATPTEVDLFDRSALRVALAGHDCVVQMATNIPTGPAATDPSAWRVNDSLRRVAAPAIAGAATDVGVGRYIQESITFPYVDGSDKWVDEEYERSYNSATDSVAAAEAAAAGVTNAGGVGIVLRFAMFMAPDSAHTASLYCAAQRGLFGLVGDLEGYVSFIHMNDAAAAVVAALAVPAGTYNVAEPDPVRRSEHRRALAGAVDRSQLEPIPAPSGGSGTNILARSHRISSQRLRDVSSWTPTVHCVDHWKDVR